MLLYYVRHGDPIYDPDSLTPLGMEQAAAVARRLAKFGVDEIYSSPSTRAMQTGSYTCEATGKPMQILDFLNCQSSLLLQNRSHPILFAKKIMKKFVRSMKSLPKS